MDLIKPFDYVLTPEYCTNSTLYDYGFYPGPYSDEVAADNYKHLLLQCDKKCWSTGNKWTVGFALLGFGNMMMAIQALVLAIGVWFFPSRFIGLMCQTCCNLFFFAVLLVVTVFRFDPMGQLTALSQGGSSYTMVDGVATLSTDTTYEMDGKRLLNLWICSLVFLVGQCLLACYAAAPPT